MAYFVQNFLLNFSSKIFWVHLAPPTQWNFLKIIFFINILF